ncbi:MAG: hypothetical protein RLZZ290_1275 [Pseudomonadota bacterium]
MPKPLGLLLLLVFLCFPAVALHSASSGPSTTLHVGVCKVGSACRSCVERHEVKVWREGSQVMISGQDPAGRPLLESLRDCAFKGNGDWSCSSGLHQVQSISGKVRLLPAAHGRSHGHEWCDLGE